jgi:ADP-ribosylglycohydrolase
MAGAILGAAHGYKVFPKKWLRGLEDKKRIITMATELFRFKEEDYDV